MVHHFRGVGPARDRTLVERPLAGIRRCPAVDVAGRGARFRRRLTPGPFRYGWAMPVVVQPHNRWPRARRQLPPAVFPIRAFQQPAALPPAAHGCSGPCAVLRVGLGAADAPAGRPLLLSSQVTAARRRRRSRHVGLRCRCRHRQGQPENRVGRRNRRWCSREDCDGCRGLMQRGVHHGPRRDRRGHRGRHVDPGGGDRDVRGPPPTRRGRHSDDRSDHQCRLGRRLPSHLRLPLHSVNRRGLRPLSGPQRRDAARLALAQAVAARSHRLGHLQDRDWRPVHPSRYPQPAANAGAGAAERGAAAMARRPAEAATPGFGRHQAIRPDRPRDLSLLS